MLVVDDDPELVASIRQLLTEHGFRVVTARDGSDALRALQHEPPSAIVLDINMPGVDGPTFAREMRQQLRHIPLIVLTGASDPQREADRCNAEAYLRKPFDSADFVRVVRRFAS